MSCKIWIIKKKKKGPKIAFIQFQVKDKFFSWFIYFTKRGLQKTDLGLSGTRQPLKQISSQHNRQSEFI